MSEKYEITTLEQLREVIPQKEKDRQLLDRRIFDHIDEFAERFIAQSPLVFIASSNAAGHVDVTSKGDMPGFVELQEDKKTLIFPERSGNSDARIFRSVLENNQIAMLFIVPKAGEYLRVTGTASISCDPEILGKLISCGKPARLCLKISVKESFFNCKRAFNRSHLWNPEKWPQELEPFLVKQTVKRLNKFEKDKSKHMTEESFVKDIADAIEEWGEKDGAY